MSNTYSIQDAFAALALGQSIEGAAMPVTHESIRAFGEATLDFNALHFDEGVAAQGGVQAGAAEVIAHGMGTFCLITRMLTEWGWPLSAEHRRLETRWRLPVRPGDTIRTTAIVKSKLETAGSRWAVLDVEVHNQHGQVVATGEATAEFPTSISTLKETAK